MYYLYVIYVIVEEDKINYKTKKIRDIYDCTRCLTTRYAQDDSTGSFIKIKSNTKKGYEEAKEGDSINFSVPSSKTRRGRVGKGKAQTLDTQCNQGVIEKTNIRRLTQIECERLQGFPDDWTKYGIYDGKVKEIPKTQRYKLMGNAVTTKVVAEIFRRIKLK